MTSKPDADCGVCREIPAHMKVELLHTPERLPAAVERLTAIGGSGIYGAEQLRKCPACGTYYSFIHDHDSEAGVGYGWTDEVVTRLTRDGALELAQRAATAARSAITHWAGEARSGSACAARYLTESRQELERLAAELTLLADSR